MRIKNDGPVQNLPKIYGLRPEILLAVVIADGVWRDYTRRGLTITEVTGGEHSQGSKHFIGLAVDIRTRNLPDTLSPEFMAERLRERLGQDFDVTVESTHIHIEYDPK